MTLTKAGGYSLLAYYRQQRIGSQQNLVVSPGPLHIPSTKLQGACHHSQAHPQSLVNAVASLLTLGRKRMPAYPRGLGMRLLQARLQLCKLVTL